MMHSAHEPSGLTPFRLLRNLMQSRGYPGQSDHKLKAPESWSSLEFERRRDLVQEIVRPRPQPTGGISPSTLAKQPASGQGPTVSNEVQGVAEEAPLSPTGLSQPGPDGVSTVIVAARPCGVAAHETDGTTTCIGIPGRVRGRGGPHSGEGTTTGMSHR
jgi:hypothetical protein